MTSTTTVLLGAVATLATLLVCAPVALAGPDESHEYCIVGAGAGGLQLAYYLDRGGYDYVVIERAEKAGSWFAKFPRDRKLISINKIYTGNSNEQFNWRHDWNSLLSDDDTLRMKNYDKNYWPHADNLVRMFNDYAEKLKLNVHYNTEVKLVDRDESGAGPFTLKTHKDGSNAFEYSCDTVVMATGTPVENIPSHNVANLESYSNFNNTPESFEGKSVLILGAGNSAFETADVALNHANFIHLCGRSRVKLSWETHYVGDVRAINNGLLDQYMLKSLDALLEHPVEHLRFDYNEETKQYFITPNHMDPEILEDHPEWDYNEDIWPLREPYDRVIRCLGFKFDDSIFAPHLKPVMTDNGKYPKQTDEYQSQNVPGLYFAGTLMHMRDHRKSAGGFIHGFRYLIGALFKILEETRHQKPWPSTELPLLPSAIREKILTRVNEAPDLYQMFETLCDLVILHHDKGYATYLEGVPIDRIARWVGDDVDAPWFMVTLEYGKDFSGPGKDVFRNTRAVSQVELAHKSNFLHPVIRFFNKVNYAKLRNEGVGLEGTYAEHHMIEDFIVDWTLPLAHVLPLSEYIETCFLTDEDLKALPLDDEELKHGLDKIGRKGVPQADPNKRPEKRKRSQRRKAPRKVTPVVERAS